jgi:hypothetical protein
MNAYLKHIALPALAPALIIVLYLTPVAIFGCVNRGLIAVAITLLSTIGAFITIGLGFAAQARRDAISRWWLISALIFTTPLALVVGPLG